MRRKRHWSPASGPASGASGPSGNCAPAGGCSTGTSVSSSAAASIQVGALFTFVTPRLGDRSSRTRLGELQQQLLRALVAGRDLQRRERLLSRLGAPAAPEITLRQVGQGGRLIDRLERDHRAELA